MISWSLGKQGFEDETLFKGGRVVTSQKFYLSDSDDKPGFTKPKSHLKATLANCKIYK
jgi:hypothetical protein